MNTPGACCEADPATGRGLHPLGARFAPLGTGRFAAFSSRSTKHEGEVALRRGAVQPSDSSRRPRRPVRSRSRCAHPRGREAHIRRGGSAASSLDDAPLAARAMSRTRSSAPSGNGITASVRSVSDNGRRCAARDRLGFRSTSSRWLAVGQASVENLRLRCRAHNQVRGRTDFRGWISCAASRIQSRRAARSNSARRRSSRRPTKSSHGCGRSRFHPPWRGRPPSTA